MCIRCNINQFSVSLSPRYYVYARIPMSRTLLILSSLDEEYLACNIAALANVVFAWSFIYEKTNVTKSKFAIQT